MRAALTVLVLVAFLILGTTASAQPTGPEARVAVVGLPDDAPLVQHLRVELHDLGFEVVVMKALSSDRPWDELEELARDAEVAAAIHVEKREHPQLELWVLDRVTGKLVRRKIDTTTADPEPRVIALQAIELLRASLRELDTPRPPPPGEVEPSKPVTKLIEEPPPQVELLLAGGAAASTGGLGFSGHLVLQARWVPRRSWGLAGFAALPLHGLHIEERGVGSATVHPGLAGGGPVYRLRPEHQRWQLVLTVGGGAAVLRMQGAALPPFSSETDVASTPIVFGQTAFEADMSRVVRLHLGLTGTVALPAATVQFAGRDVATWGAPVGLLTLGLGFGVH